MPAAIVASVRPWKAPSRHLDRGFHRLCAGVGEEHLVGKRHFAKAFGKPFLARYAIEIRSMPKLARLLGQRGDEIRMSVAQDVDGHACGEIKISIARRCKEIGALATIEFDIKTRIGPENR